MNKVNVYRENPNPQLRCWPPPPPPSSPPVTNLKKENERNYLFSALVGALWIAFVNWIFPGVIPFNTFDFWTSKHGFIDGVLAGWPIFAWGAGLQTFLCVIHRDTSRASGTETFIKGLFISTWAGFMEEVCFRWLIFLSAIPGIKFFNFLFFGFLGFGVPEWLHVHVIGWLANLTTFGNLHDFLYHKSGFAVGAAVLSANAFFRNGHKYQGLLGVLNSWFAGMFFFWIMFNYGLWPAIAVHFTYDLLVFTVVAISRALR